MHLRFILKLNYLLNFKIKSNFYSIVDFIFYLILMREFKVSGLLEGYRVEETIQAVSIHHAIKIMKAKYGNSARNIIVLN